jgi:hypothetical protein
MAAWTLHDLVVHRSAAQIGRPYPRQDTRLEYQPKSETGEVARKFESHPLRQQCTGHQGVSECHVFFVLEESLVPDRNVRKGSKADVVTG